MGKPLNAYVHITGGSDIGDAVVEAIRTVGEFDTVRIDYYGELETQHISVQLDGIPPLGPATIAGDVGRAIVQIAPKADVIVRSPNRPDYFVKVSEFRHLGSSAEDIAA